MSAIDGASEWETLLDWLEGRLDPVTADRVAAEVECGDERLRATVDWLQSFLKVARDVPLADPPPLVRQRLSQHFARWKRARAVLAEQQSRVVHARLLFDSRKDMALTNVRAADVEAAVHLAFTSDSGDVLLDVTSLPAQGLRIDGQVLTPEAAKPTIFEATLDGGGARLRTVDGDELGRFSLTDVPRALCRLNLDNGVVSILAELDLSSFGERL